MFTENEDSIETAKACLLDILFSSTTLRTEGNELQKFIYRNTHSGNYATTPRILQVDSFFFKNNFLDNLWLEAIDFDSVFTFEISEEQVNGSTVYTTNTLGYLQNAGKPTASFYIMYLDAFLEKHSIYAKNLKNLKDVINTATSLNEVRGVASLFGENIVSMLVSFVDEDFNTPYEKLIPVTPAKLYSDPYSAYVQEIKNSLFLKKLETIC